MDFNNLKKLDYKKIINVVKNNYDKDAGLFTVVLVLIIFFGIKQFVQPAIIQLGDNMAKLNQKKAELQGYQERERFMLSPESQKTKKNLPINIYKAPYAGMDTESASVELVQEIIKIIKETGNNRINQINFTTEELKDDSGTNSTDYSVLSLNLSIESTFEAIQNALNEIYLMNYLVVIKNVSSTPIENQNAELIKTDLTLNIYVKLNTDPNAIDANTTEPGSIR